MFVRNQAGVKRRRRVKTTDSRLTPARQQTPHTLGRSRRCVAECVPRTNSSAQYCVQNRGAGESPRAGVSSTHRVVRDDASLGIVWRSGRCRFQRGRYGRWRMTLAYPPCLAAIGCFDSGLGYRRVVTYGCRTKATGRGDSLLAQFCHVAPATTPRWQSGRSSSCNRRRIPGGNGAVGRRQNSAVAIRSSKQPWPRRPGGLRRCSQCKAAAQIFTDGRRRCVNVLQRITQKSCTECSNIGLSFSTLATLPSISRRHPRSTMSGTGPEFTQNANSGDCRAIHSKRVVRCQPRSLDSSSGPRRSR